MSEIQAILCNNYYFNELLWLFNNQEPTKCGGYTFTISFMQIMTMILLLVAVVRIFIVQNIKNTEIIVNHDYETTGETAAEQFHV